MITNDRADGKEENWINFLRFANIFIYTWRTNKIQCGKFP